MCGRFTQGFSETHYAIRLDAGWTPVPLDLKPTWNMAPNRQALVLHDDNSGHVAELLYWGFLPSWADPAASKLSMHGWRPLPRSPISVTHGNQGAA
jgi:putative SOS response-associated peptidase YedK